MKGKTIDDIIDEVLWDNQGSVLCKSVIERIKVEIEMRRRKYEKP